MIRQTTAAVAVPACEVTEVSAIDVFCRPVDLNQTTCNCSFGLQLPCLVHFIADHQLAQVDSNLDTQSPNWKDVSRATSDEELYAESFIVKGSYHEDRYQRALLKCSEAKRKKENILVRVNFEPNNIEDKNAIKFEVYFDNEWLIIGYCSVKKIPKLNKAMKRNQLRTLILTFVKREWIHWKASFCFHACVTVVKRGKWDKDELNNHYNSVLDK